MKKQTKKYKSGIIKKKVSEPKSSYQKSTLRVFNSFEEQNLYELKEMASLTPLELLQRMRAYINLAYGMRGYNPENLPKKHFIRIL